MDVASVDHTMVMLGCGERSVSQSVTGVCHYPWWHRARIRWMFWSEDIGLKVATCVQVMLDFVGGHWLLRVQEIL
jgi:hypothetical protein